MKELIKRGRVSTVYADRCTARVKFDDDQSVSRELHILMKGTQGTKEYWVPEIGETVLCLFPMKSTEGFIIGGYYGEGDQIPVTESSKRHITFSDGASVEYDTKTHVMTFDFSGIEGAKVVFKNCIVEGLKGS